MLLLVLQLIMRRLTDASLPVLQSIFGHARSDLRKILRGPLAKYFVLGLVLLLLPPSFGADRIGIALVCLYFMGAGHI